LGTILRPNKVTPTVNTTVNTTVTATVNLKRQLVEKICFFLVAPPWPRAPNFDLASTLASNRKKTGSISPFCYSMRAVTKLSRGAAAKKRAAFPPFYYSMRAVTKRSRGTAAKKTGSISPYAGLKKCVTKRSRGAAAKKRAAFPPTQYLKSLSRNGPGAPQKNGQHFPLFTTRRAQSRNGSGEPPRKNGQHFPLRITATDGRSDWRGLGAPARHCLILRPGSASRGPSGEAAPTHLPRRPTTTGGQRYNHSALSNPVRNDTSLHPKSEQHLRLTLESRLPPESPMPSPGNRTIPRREFDPFPRGPPSLWKRGLPATQAGAWFTGGPGSRGEGLVDIGPPRARVRDSRLCRVPTPTRPRAPRG
jgi:hypothetical protein